MSHPIIAIRNSVVSGVYRGVFRPILFRFDPENVHDRFIWMGAVLGATAFGRAFMRGLFGYKDAMLEQDILGIHFDNPIGLAAGFDKDAELTRTLPSIGFGFMEVGSITGKACAGNPKPRLWRLPRSRGLVVHYGLKNQGCEAVSTRLARELEEKSFSIPVGISVAMTNCAENMDIDNAIRDYEHAFRMMEPIGDYMTVNISCPNAVSGQPFLLPDNIDRLFRTLDVIPTAKPIFVKMSPDLSTSETDAILAVLEKHRVHGIITSNLTKRRDNPRIIDPAVPERGGMSGKVAEESSDRMLEHIYRRQMSRKTDGAVNKDFILIGCGGVFSAEDAYRKIRLGASLIQMITGMIFEGPQVISEINRGLGRLLARDGFTHISQAIGADIRW